jgi:hypothetical protein
LDVSERAFESLNAELGLGAEPPPGGADANGPRAPTEKAPGATRAPSGADAVRIVTVEDFAAVAEEGAAAILGTTDAALIPEGGDVMVYGDGGVGKTTLTTDLGFHLAAGDDWLGIPVPKPSRVLIVENEGSRPWFRRKLGRKHDGWAGSPVAGRLHVWQDPWGRVSFATREGRQRLAEAIRALEIDVVIAGPVASLGMDTAGTMQEVRTFAAHVAEVRRLSGRPVAIILVHHENKGGKVSGAWEGVGDTLLHVLQQGHGKLRLYVQKARTDSERHGTKLQLVWAPGDAFALADAEPDRPERVWDDIEEFVLANGGCGWNGVDSAVSGQGDYKRQRRDAMLSEGIIINAGHGQKFELWHRDDPARPTLDTTASEGGRGSDAVASEPGDEPGKADRVPASALKGDAGRDAVGSASPADPNPVDAGGDE